MNRRQLIKALTGAAGIIGITSTGNFKMQPKDSCARCGKALQTGERIISLPVHSKYVAYHRECAGELGHELTKLTEIDREDYPDNNTFKTFVIGEDGE